LSPHPLLSRSFPPPPTLLLPPHPLPDILTPPLQILKPTLFCILYPSSTEQNDPFYLTLLRSFSSSPPPPLSSPPSLTNHHTPFPSPPGPPSFLISTCPFPVHLLLFPPIFLPFVTCSRFLSPLPLFSTPSSFHWFPPSPRIFLLSFFPGSQHYSLFTSSAPLSLRTAGFLPFPSPTHSLPFPLLCCPSPSPLSLPSLLFPSPRPPIFHTCHPPPPGPLIPSPDTSPCPTSCSGLFPHSRPPPIFFLPP